MKVSEYFSLWAHLLTSASYFPSFQIPKKSFFLLFSEQDIVKPEKTVSHGKPGILQVVFVVSNYLSMV